MKVPAINIQCREHKQGTCAIYKIVSEICSFYSANRLNFPTYLREDDFFSNDHLIASFFFCNICCMIFISIATIFTAAFVL